MVDPTGYTALDLIGFTDKGDYNPLSTYLKNDLANFNGTKWRCKVDDTTGVTPSEGLTWTAFMVLPTDHTMDMIAPIETSPSANAYVTGKQLIFNEVLYDVIDDIAIGDTLEVGVNIDTSDTIVEKIEDANGAIQQLTEIIAPVEGATSLHAYAVGEQLIYNDTLYKVIAPIAVNDALVVDTNIEVSPKTVIEQVEDNAEGIEELNDAWKKNGAYNLCNPNIATSQVINGVTFTVNADGSVTANGTASDRINFSYTTKSALLQDILPFKGKTLKVCGCPSGGGGESYWVAFQGLAQDGIDVIDTGNGATATISDFSSFTTVQIYIAVIKNTVLNNVIFKPMITTDLNATYADYVPYAKTNRELTEVKTFTPTVTSSQGTGTLTIKQRGITAFAYLLFTPSSTINEGTDIQFSISGSFPTPLDLGNVTGYAGTAAIVGFINNSKIQVRTVNSSLAAGSSCAVYGTYIVK